MYNEALRIQLSMHQTGVYYLPKEKKPIPLPSNVSENIVQGTSKHVTCLEEPSTNICPQTNTSKNIVQGTSKHVTRLEEPSTNICPQTNTSKNIVEGTSRHVTFSEEPPTGSYPKTQLINSRLKARKIKKKPWVAKIDITDQFYAALSLLKNARVERKTLADASLHLTETKEANKTLSKHRQFQRLLRKTTQLRLCTFFKAVLTTFFRPKPCKTRLRKMVKVETIRSLTQTPEIIDAIPLASPTTQSEEFSFPPESQILSPVGISQENKAKPMNLGRTMILDLLKQDPSKIGFFTAHLDPTTPRYFNFILEAIKQTPQVIRFLDIRGPRYSEIILAAIQENPEALPPELQKLYTKKTPTRRIFNIVYPIIYSLSLIGLTLYRL